MRSQMIEVHGDVAQNWSHETVRSAYKEAGFVCWAALMATMTPGRWINLAAVALGTPGAIILYKWSFAFESFGQWHDAASIKVQTARNLQRQTMQRVGLGLTCASFVPQGLALFFD
jgi:hypothetical protein